MQSKVVINLMKFAIPARQHISNNGHDFKKDKEFTLLQTIQNINKPKRIIQNTLNKNAKHFG